ncbi:nucleotidyltransferase [Algoriphagus litoralis]|uniref:nucleotidyltransferase n=1 Tax=Algoriphagus litoralis TaxID=2202829 RepID=UPI000DB9ADA9|nr:nucleotidyltransferase [Algoriphagus litoralis]
MILFPDFEDFIGLLNAHSVDYMVVGGYALAFHGKPRNTGDLDIWIEISETNATKLLKVLVDFGFGNLNFKKEDFTKPGYITQIGYPPLRIDILNTIDGVEFKDAYPNSKIIKTENLEIRFIGLKDFIQNKSASGRPQDLVDIQEIKKRSK